MELLLTLLTVKPMFVIHTDHTIDKRELKKRVQHQGYIQTQPHVSYVCYHVETISQIVSPKDIFPETDLRH
jgi:hypothetical protein